MITGHWLQATPIIPSLRFPAPLFATALRVRLGLPHPCPANYVACACGHPLDPLGIHFLRCARGGERTSSHDSVRDVYHIIRESGQHAQRAQTGFLPSSAPGGRGGRVDIVISDAAACHTLIDIVVADPTRGTWWSVLRASIWWLPQMQSGVRRRTTEIAQAGRCLYRLL